MTARRTDPALIDTSTFDIPTEVALFLRDALAHRASDIHIEAVTGGYELRRRVDGILETIRRYDADAGRGIVTRLMVLAQLLTYRQDVPQEGRMMFAVDATGAEGDPPGRLVAMRIATMPTMHGLRAVIRLPAELWQPHRLDELGLPPSVHDGLKEFCRADAGLLLLTGPAGSGKTTTIYALLEHIAATTPGASIVALEDPVERDLPGVTQIEVAAFGELTYAKALRSILRQDPQILMLGEIRDRETASIAVQAALSGHRLISTLHAGTPGGAIARLLEMGLEPYQVTSALFAVVSQRLVRKRRAASSASDGQADPSYAGRVPIAEIARIDGGARQAILNHGDAETIQTALRQQPGYVTMSSAAADAIRTGLTDAAEVNRVMGLNMRDS